MKYWTKWNRKMGGRSFNITSGAFKDTLVGGVQGAMKWWKYLFYGLTNCVGSRFHYLFIW